MHIYRIFMLVTVVTGALSAQKPSLATSYKHPGLLYNMSYAFQMPAADLADRFGRNANVGVSLEYRTGQNWLTGLEFNYAFGQKVLDDPLKFLRNSEGYIYGVNRQVGGVVLRERGYYGGGYVGRWFPKVRTKSASGPRFTVGLGFMEHKIRIQDDQNTIAQLEGDYLKGYDRLSNGLAINQSVGWQYMSKGGANFSIALEATEGFTKNRRSFDFELGKPMTGKRLDILYGIRATWMLPIYSFTPSEEIFY